MTTLDGMEYQEGSYEQKLNLLPRTIAEWLRPHGGIDGKDILDFGCGEATTALGLTRHHAPRSVLGVDIMPDVHLCLPLASRQLGLDRLPANLQLRQIQPGPLDCPDGSFDLIYSWSVFEHVDRDLLATVLQDLRRLLRPAGHLFIQISPLYYSSQGSHLGGLIPEPWAHLTNQLDTYRSKLRDVCPDDEIFSILWSTYATLNRLTAAELLELVTGCGFTILRQQTTSDGPAPLPPARLRPRRPDHRPGCPPGRPRRRTRRHLDPAAGRAPRQGPPRQAHEAPSQADHANGKTVDRKTARIRPGGRNRRAVVQPDCQWRLPAG